MKKYLYIILSIIGFLMFLSLYIIVCLLTEQNFPMLKHLVMILGYLSLGLFCIPFLLLLKNKEKIDK